MPLEEHWTISGLKASKGSTPPSGSGVYHQCRLLRQIRREQLLNAGPATLVTLLPPCDKRAQRILLHLNVRSAAIAYWTGLPCCLAAPEPTNWLRFMLPAAILLLGP